jgi:hypothetical protein
MRRIPWLTIQNRSLPTFRSQHSGAHGDKDQYDEKQPRQQACAPFQGANVNPHNPQNQSNVFQIAMPVSRATSHLIREIALISARLCEASDHKWAKLCVDAKEIVGM